MDAKVGQSHAVVRLGGFFLGFRTQAIVSLDDEANARGGRWDGRVIRRIGDVLAGESESAIQACDKLEELGDVFQL